MAAELPSCHRYVNRIAPTLLVPVPLDRFHGRIPGVADSMSESCDPVSPTAWSVTSP